MVDCPTEIGKLYTFLVVSNFGFYKNKRLTKPYPHGAIPQYGDTLMICEAEEIGRVSGGCKNLRGTRHYWKFKIIHGECVGWITTDGDWTKALELSDPNFLA